MLLTAKELARQLDVHITTIRRAYRSEEIPYERLGKLYFFDLDQVRQAMRANSRAFSQVGGAARPAASAAARGADEPPTGKTGASIARKGRKDQ